MLEAAREAVRIANGSAKEERDMAIFVDQDTKVIVQGLTGGQGKFHGLRNRDYGTQVVAGVTPGKGGQDVEGIPVFDTVAEAVAATGATASFVAVPPKAAPAAILEAARGRHRVRRLHHRGHPGPGRGAGLQHAGPRLPGDPPARAQLPGHHQPRQVQHRHHAQRHRPAADGRRSQRRHRQPLRHADLPGALRAEAERHRRVDVRRHRRRPGARARASSTAWPSSRRTRRPTPSSCSARSAARPRRRRPSSSPPT